MIPAAIKSLQKQTMPCDIVVVDNGSRDGSLELLQTLADKGEITLIAHATNLGFTGGVNAGMQWALDNNYKAVALLNNDAVADKHWVQYLYKRLMQNEKTGTVTGNILSSDGKTIDSTGDLLSTWGLPYPRGRGEPVSTVYNFQTEILGASGGATIFKCAMLRQVGLYDQDFFAYYEDTDLSIRTRLAGWQILFEPKATVYHKISATSSRVKGFTTYQTIKNLPWVLIKNIPAPLLVRMLPRFFIAYWAFFGKAMIDRRGWPALCGWAKSVWLMPKKIIQRFGIQRQRVISVAELDKLLLHDLPPNAKQLRRLRKMWWRLTGRGAK